MDLPAVTQRLAEVEEGSPAGGYLIHVATPGVDASERTLRLTQGAMVVGSADDATVTLRDSAVSRQHLRLTIDGGQLVLEDLGSTNGTMYLGQRLEKARIHSAAQLQLGHSRLEIVPYTKTFDLPLAERDSYEGIVGGSPAMRRIYSMLEMLETTEAPVLIRGETGVGKEVVARAIHARSARASQPLIPIDCANLSPTLAESSLFGHVKGAFTGAIRDNVGPFELGDGGTVFLDEIGELTPELQARLLRVLDTGEVLRVGDTQRRRVDVRVVAATHRDLRAMMASGDFRPDLYYRIAVVTVSVPPLRDRRQDIPMLVEHLASVLGVDPGALPEAATTFFLRYAWPGNVRELRNAVHRVATLGAVEPVGPQTSGSAPPAVDSDQGFKEARALALQQFEAAYLESLMQQHGDNLSAAARAAGIDRKYLRQMLRRHGLH